MLDSREGAGPFHFLLGAFTVFFSDKMNRRTVAACKHRTPDDLVFCTRKGGPLGKRNLLRHIKVAATKLGLLKSVNFRNFRTMHSSLMLREGCKAGGRPPSSGSEGCFVFPLRLSSRGPRSLSVPPLRTVHESFQLTRLKSPETFKSCRKGSQTGSA